MYQLGEIGMFQLENLIRNQVPFKLFLVGAAKPAQADRPSSRLLDRFFEQTFEINKHDALGQIRALSLEQQAPIILAAPERQVAHELAEEMASSGYLNCYHLAVPWEEALEQLQEI